MQALYMSSFSHHQASSSKIQQKGTKEGGKAWRSLRCQSVCNAGYWSTGQRSSKTTFSQVEFV
jgi:hypothetical protein